MFRVARHTMDMRSVVRQCAIRTWLMIELSHTASGARHTALQPAETLDVRDPDTRFACSLRLLPWAIVSNALHPSTPELDRLAGINLGWRCPEGGV